MSELPPGWTSLRLGEVADFEMGQAPPGRASNFAGHGTVFVKAGEFGHRHPIVREWTTEPKKFATAKDVLICVVGATAGKLNLGIDCAIGRSVAAIRPSTAIRQRLLYLQLLTRVGELRAASTGSAQGVISRDMLERIQLVLPPLPEQKRIADKLDTLLARVDACRQRLDRVPGILKRFRQSVLAAATSGELTRDWREAMGVSAGTASREVQSCLVARRGKYSNRSKFKEPSAPDLSHRKPQVPDSWSVESVSAFAECLDHLRVPIMKDKRATSERLYPYYGANGLVDMVDNFLFDDELVLVTEDETFYGRKKPIAYRTSGRCWVNNHAHVLLAGDRVRADYLCFSLMHYDVSPWLTGTTGRAKLTQGALNALPLAVPPQAEMGEIVRRVLNLFGFADRIETRAIAVRAQTQRLTALFLDKAFRGELVPQDPNDEPASVLLDQIRASTNAHAGKVRGKRGIRRVRDRGIAENHAST